METCGYFKQFLKITNLTRTKLGTSYETCGKKYLNISQNIRGLNEADPNRSHLNPSFRLSPESIPEKESMSTNQMNII